MRDYGTVTPSFWRGKTGRDIRNLGSQAQLVALYLMTAPDSNLIGLYSVPLLIIAHETCCQVEEVQLILDALACLDWAYYDIQTETVWVRNMAFYQVAERLKQKDNRWKAVVKELGSYNSSPFFIRFLDVYGEPFGLSGYFKVAPGCIDNSLGTPSTGVLRIIRKQKNSPSKPLGSPSQAPSESILATVLTPSKSLKTSSQGPSKPLPSQEQEQKQEQEQEQEQKQEQREAVLAPTDVPACQLPEFIERDLKAFGIVKAAVKLSLLQDLGRHGLRCALLKLSTKAGAKNLAGLLVTRGKELAQEGETILREAAMKALAGAPAALKDPRWCKLPAELQDDLEAQAAWAVWLRTESHMRACPGDDEAPRAEKAARRPLLAILAERHPDQAGFKARLEATMSAMSAGGLTPQALKLAAMTAALGL